MLTRDTILGAFRLLSERLGQRGVVGEIDLLRGTAMVFGFQARQTTKDVDAIFAPAPAIREEARAIADELGLPGDWLNDAAKGFASDRPELRDLAGLELPNLRVLVPTGEYLLAMKVMASRAAIGADRGDKEDIRFLIRRLGLRDTGSVMEIVERYYDPARIQPRSSYLVDEILAEDEGSHE